MRGNPYCSPHCPRFFDDEGRPLLIEPYEPENRDLLADMYADIDASRRTPELPPALTERRTA